jgi:hypothetical protein
MIVVFAWLLGAQVATAWNMFTSVFGRPVHVGIVWTYFFGCVAILVVLAAGGLAIRAAQAAPNWFRQWFDRPVLAFFVLAVIILILGTMLGAGGVATPF